MTFNFSLRVAAGRGFEPLLAAPKAAVLPLDDPASVFVPANFPQSIAGGIQNRKPASRAPSAIDFTIPW